MAFQEKEHIQIDTHVGTIKAVERSLACLSRLSPALPFSATYAVLFLWHVYRGYLQLPLLCYLRGSVPLACLSRLSPAPPSMLPTRFCSSGMSIAAISRSPLLCYLRGSVPLRLRA
jgi:hypothetical protein